MRIAHVAGTVAIHTHYELLVLGPRACRIALSPVETWTPVVGGPVAIRPHFGSDFLALSPSGERVAVRRRVTRTTADRYGMECTDVADELSVVDLPARIAYRCQDDAISFATDEAMLSARPLGASTPGFLVAGFGALERIRLPAPVAVSWPSRHGAIWEGPVPWQDAGPSPRSRVTSNAFGHVVADQVSGIVARFEDDPARMTAYRVPAEGEHSEIEIQAFATPAGFVVAHGGGRSGGALNHFSTSGAHLGAVPVAGNLSDVVVLPAQLLFLREMADFSGNFELVVASLPGLDISQAVATTISTYDGYPGLAARDDGRVVWVGCGSRVERLENAGATWTREPVALGGIPAVDLTESSESFETRRPAASPAPAFRFVVHPKFGKGRVVSQEGHGAEAKLEVAFADRVRKLQAKFVRDA